MSIEINYSGKEESFEGMQDALWFASGLDGFDVWVDDELFMSCYRDCFTGSFVSELYYA